MGKEKNVKEEEEEEQEEEEEEQEQEIKYKYENPFAMTPYPSSLSLFLKVHGVQLHYGGLIRTWRVELVAATHPRKFFLERRKQII